MTRRIYTRTGDAGDTGLFGGGRVPKSHPRVEAYGAVDELNAVLGAALSGMTDEISVDRLRLVQHDLFALGASLAVAPAGPDAADRPRPRVPPLPDERVAAMEAWMDEADEELEPLATFILPGGSEGASALHVARTVCRRAERAVVALAAAEAVPGAVVVYLNRLADLLFVLARLENLRTGEGDVPWSKDP